MTFPVCLSTPQHAGFFHPLRETVANCGVFVPSIVGEGVVLAIGVIALAAFIVVALAALLRPEMLE